MLTRGPVRHNDPFHAGSLISGAIFFFLAALNTSVTCALAQVVTEIPPSAQAFAQPPKPDRPASNSGALKTLSRPQWPDLTPVQQLSLQPLAASWNTLEDASKRKWIALAANYPNLTPAEQLKLHSRMTEWVALSPRQRDQARLNFARSKQHTPTQKAATWQAYQALSPEEKKKLAISAPPKPVGAAAAAKPVPPQKLATIPVTRHTPKQIPRTAAATRGVNRNTLLPHSSPSAEPASTKKRQTSQDAP
jgi:hypothetical protein